MTGNTAFILWYLLVPIAMAWSVQRSGLRFVQLSAWPALALWLIGVGALVFTQRRCGGMFVEDYSACDGLTVGQAAALANTGALAAILGSLVLPALILTALLAWLVRRS